MLRELARKILPIPVRRALLARVRANQFHPAVRRFADLGPNDKVPVELLQRLVDSWGNSWSAQWEYLDSILTQLRETSGPVLECGSGLSTLLIGIRCKQLGREVWAMEHTPQWAERLQGYLKRYSVDSVHLCSAPLVSYPTYDWYDKSLIPADLRFGLVICDGPPWASRGGRYGLVPLMIGQFAPGCRVFVDDAGRPEEQEMLATWARDFGLRGDTEGQEKPYAVVIKPAEIAAVSD